jgi:MFS family permease
MNRIEHEADMPELTLAAAAGPVAATWLIQVVMALGTLAVPALAPEIAAELGVEATLVGGFATLLWLSAIAASLMTGALIERWGPLRMGQLCLVLYAAGLAAAAHGSLVMLALSAIGIGLGCGPETPASSALLARAAPVRWRNLIFSLKQTGLQVGGILAGFIFPALAIAMGWRSIMLVTALAALTTAVAIEPLRRRYDVLARRAENPGRLGFGAALRVLWRAPALRRLTFAGFAFCAMQICLNTFLVTYGVLVLGYDLALAGSMLALAQAGGLIGRLFWGVLAGTMIGTPIMLSVLGFAMSASAVAVGLATAAWPVPLMLVLSFIFGLTASGWNGVMLAEMTRHASTAALGPIMGAMMAFGYLGLVIGPVVFGIAAALFGLGGGYVALAVLSLAGTCVMIGLAVSSQAMSRQAMSRQDSRAPR